MRNLLVQRISNKPPIRHIHPILFQRSPQRTNAVDILNQHNFEQNNRINAGTSIVFAAQILNKFIHLIKVDRCIDLTQQMVLRNHLFQTYKLNLISVFNIFRKYVYHPYLLFHFSNHFTRKRPPVGDLFRQAEAAPG